MGLGKLLKRVFRVGEAKANSAIDNMEDPILMTEQGIRELKEQLGKAIKAQATVEGQKERTIKDQANFSKQSKEWVGKAEQLKAKYKANEGNEDMQSTIKEAMITALNKQENMSDQAQNLDATVSNLQTQCDNISGSVKSVRDAILDAEGQLKDLKSRSKVAEASLDANKAMSDFDPSSVQSLLNRQKEKVDTMEAEAMGYQNVSNSNKSSEDVVNDLLAADSPTENNKLLTDFLSK